MIFYTLAALAVLGTMALAMIRALKGPTVYDRIVALNMIGTKTVLLVPLITFITGNTDLIDVALVYALINFIAMIAVLKLVKHRDLSVADDRETADA